MSTVVEQPVLRREPNVGSYYFGFTGTGKAPGMTSQQMDKVYEFLLGSMPCVLHLGDCVYADAQAFHIAQSLGVYTVGHPPSDDRKRSFCMYDETRHPLPYLQRNHVIVMEGEDGLIATPRIFHMPRILRGQGTWWTIRDAIRQERDLHVFLPDGSEWTP